MVRRRRADVAYIRDASSSVPADILLFKKMAGLPKQPRRGFTYGVSEGLDYFPPMARYRKVTIWPLVQVSFGANVVSVMPFVTPSSTAQATAFA